MTGGRVDCYERLDKDKLSQVLNDKFEFYLEKKDNKTQVIDCPDALTRNIISASRWDGMPHLKGIIKLPVLKLDGTVTMANGYDSESQYLLDFDPKKFDLKANPTMADALEAYLVLMDLISECAVASPKSRSGILAMLLTAVSRSSYEYAPLFAISANTPGAGKGALTELATVLATGSPDSGMTTFNPEEVEFKKALLATLQRGSPVVSFDNIDRRHELGGSNLESALTSPNFSGRMLGTNDMASFPTKVLWLANGNRLRISIDMCRRTIMIYLDAKEENILEKSYSRDMIRYAMQNRGKLVSACLTILQAFILEKPQIDVKPMNGYFEWSNLVRNSIIWLGEPDPVPTSDEIFSRDGIDEKRCILDNLLEAWHGSFGCLPKTSREVISAAITSDPGIQHKDNLRLALIDVAKDRNGDLSSTVLGNYLSNNAGNRIGNKRFGKSSGHTKKGVYWQVEQLASD
jgi:putative DNA primase/helicase